MRIEIPEHKTLVYQMPLPVRWGDMDAFGHVNNVAYFAYLETVRVEWLRHIGHLQAEGGQGVVVVNVFCNFYEQLTYPCDLLAKLYLTQVGRSSFDHVVMFERTDQPEKVCAAGGATIVWVNFAQQKALPLPEDLRQQLRAHADAA